MPKKVKLLKFVKKGQVEAVEIESHILLNRHMTEDAPGIGDTFFHLRPTVGALFNKLRRDLDLPKVGRFDYVKTHKGFVYTGAIKNFFGLLGNKMHMHMTHAEKSDFQKMLADIYFAVEETNKTEKPKVLTIMDCVVAMSGNGPRNGKLQQIGLNSKLKVNFILNQNPNNPKCRTAQSKRVTRACWLFINRPKTT